MYKYIYIDIVTIIYNVVPMPEKIENMDNINHPQIVG